MSSGSTGDCALCRRRPCQPNGPSEGRNFPRVAPSTRPRRITKPGGRTTVRELGAVLDAVWSKRSEVREQLKAVVPDLAARARLTAVRALRLAQQRGERG